MSVPSEPPAAIPMAGAEGEPVTRFLILTKVPEGYEGRCYWVGGLKPGVSLKLPLGDLQPEWAALYDNDGTCIRVLD